MTAYEMRMSDCRSVVCSSDLSPKMVRAAQFRTKCGQLAQVPFSYQIGSIARAAEERRQCGRRGRKSDIADGQRLFKADGKTILITPRYKRRTRGRTDGGIGIALSKAHAARGDRIDRRGYVIAPTVAAHVCVAAIIGPYEQNIGRPHPRQERKRGGQGKRE